MIESACGKIIFNVCSCALREMEAPNFILEGMTLTSL